MVTSTSGMFSVRRPLIQSSRIATFSNTSNHIAGDDGSDLSQRRRQYMQGLFLTDPKDGLARARIRNGSKLNDGSGRSPGSCEWILAEPGYSDWHTGSGLRLLFILGEAGIGKTALSTFLVDTLLRESTTTGDAVLYFFCSHADTRRRNTVSILRGILVQLLSKEPALYDLLDEDYVVQKAASFDNIDALWRSFTKVIADPRLASASLLIDGIDECDERSQREILERLQGLPQLHNQGNAPGLKIAFCARPTNLIVAHHKGLARTQTVHMSREKISGDLIRFIETEVEAIAFSQEWSPDLRQTVEATLKGRTGGTFLWVSLVLRSSAQTRPSQVLAEINRTPDDLSAAYNRILTLIRDSRDRDLARSVLNFVLNAPIALTTAQLALLLYYKDISPNDHKPLPSATTVDALKDSWTTCDALVRCETDPNGAKRVIFIHQSVHDFLTGAEVSVQLFTKMKGPKPLYRACAAMFRTSQLKGVALDLRQLKSLSRDLKWRPAEDVFGNLPVLAKEGPGWSKACQIIETKRDSAPEGTTEDWWECWQFLVFAIIGASGVSSAFNALSLIRSVSPILPEIVLPLIVKIMNLDWESTLKDLRQNLEKEEKREPCRRGIINTSSDKPSSAESEALAKLLAQEGGDEAVRLALFQESRTLLRPLLHLAVVQGNIPAMLILVELTNEPEPDHRRCQLLTTLLVEAALSGQLRVAKTLLSKTNFLEAISRSGYRPGGSASHFLPKTINSVGLTLAMIVKIVTNCLEKKTKPSQEQKCVLEFLVNTGRETLVRGQYMSTMVHHSAAVGTVAGIMYCAKYQGEDMYAPDGCGMTPLHHAAAQGQSGVVQHLINMESHLTLSGDCMRPAAGPWLAVDDSLRLPLHYAACCGSHSATRLLIEADAGNSSLRAADELGLTALLLAEDATANAEKALQAHKEFINAYSADKDAQRLEKLKRSVLDTEHNVDTALLKLEELEQKHRGCEQTTVVLMEAEDRTQERPMLPERPRPDLPPRPRN